MLTANARQKAKIGYPEDPYGSAYPYLLGGYNVYYGSGGDNVCDVGDTGFANKIDAYFGEGDGHPVQGGVAFFTFEVATRALVSITEFFDAGPGFNHFDLAAPLYFTATCGIGVWCDGQGARPYSVDFRTEGTLLDQQGYYIDNGSPVANSYWDPPSTAPGHNVTFDVDEGLTQTALCVYAYV